MSTSSTPTVADDYNPRKRRKPSDVVSSPGSNNAYLFESGRYSDLTINCGSERFKVHRAIVCPQCAFFDAAVNGGFKESAEGVINLPEDDPETVKQMLEFMYTTKYTTVQHTTRLSQHIDVYFLARKYTYVSLANEAKRRLRAMIDNLTDEALLDGLEMLWKDDVDVEDDIREEFLRRIFEHCNYVDVRTMNFYDDNFVGPNARRRFWDIVDKCSPRMSQAMLRLSFEHVRRFKKVACIALKVGFEKDNFDVRGNRLAQDIGASCYRCESAEIMVYCPNSGLFTCTDCRSEGLEPKVRPC